MEEDGISAPTIKSYDFSSGGLTFQGACTLAPHSSEIRGLASMKCSSAMTNRTTWWDFLCKKYRKFWSPALKHYVEDKLLISEVCPHWSLQLVTTRSIYFYDLQQVHEMGFFLLLLIIWLLCNVSIKYH